MWNMRLMKNVLFLRRLRFLLMCAWPATDSHLFQFGWVKRKNKNSSSITALLTCIIEKCTLISIKCIGWPAILVCSMHPLNFILKFFRFVLFWYSKCLLGNSYSVSLRAMMRTIHTTVTTRLFITSPHGNKMINSGVKKKIDFLC